MPQVLPINRFTVLNIEEINTNDSEPANTFPSFSAPMVNTTSWKPKWKKQLPKQLFANALDAYRTFLVLLVEISTTNTSKLHSVKILLDCGATSNFIDCDFVHFKEINTQTISWSILVFNVDSSSNKAGQILEMINIVLSRGSECLSDHPRWMFKKNSMEFFIGLQFYLYYCYSGCTLKSHDHLLFPECSMVTCSFQNVLWSPDLVT